MPLYSQPRLLPRSRGGQQTGRNFDAAVAPPIWFARSLFPASEARDLLIQLTGQQFGRWATASRPRLLQFLTTRDLAFLDRATLPEEPMNLDLAVCRGN